MHFKTLAPFAVLLLAAGFARAEDPPPTGEEVLKLVRMSYALQDHKMSGTLRDDASGRREPVELTMQQQVIRFRFQNPAQIIHLDLTTHPATLWEVKPGGSSEVAVSRYDDDVRGFSMNYEDLSLRFLYWPNAKVMHEDTIKGAKCWVVRAVNPDGVGPYGTADMWVHQGSGGMARMQAYDPAGRMVKRFEVTSIQDAGDAKVLKEMKIETSDPATGKVVGRTYMKLDPPQKN